MRSLGGLLENCLCFVTVVDGRDVWGISGKILVRTGLERESFLGSGEM